MTTFTSGAVIALTLDQDDRLTFVGSGSCTVTPTYGSSWVIRLDAPGTVIGPFRQNVSLSITTTRDGSYTTDNYGDQPTYVTASTNSVTGGIEVLAGSKNLLALAHPKSFPMKSLGGYGIDPGYAFIDFASGYTFTANNSGTGSIGTGGIYGNSATLNCAAVAASYVLCKKTGVSITLDSTDVLLLVVDLIYVTNNDQIRIELSSDGFSVKSLLLTHVIKSDHGGKLYIPFVVSGATLNGGELSSNTFNYIGVRLTSNGGTCRVLGVIKNTIARPKILIQFDDGFLSQYTQAFRYMSKFGLVGDIAVIKRTVGQPAGGVDAYEYCSLNQLKAMRNAGWSMMTHGYYAHNSFGSRELLKADIQANLAYMQANELTGSEFSYVYPGGIVSTPNDSIGILQELGFKSARSIDGNPQSTYPLGIDYPWHLWSRTISENATNATLIASIDSAIACGATIRLHGHRIVTTVIDGNNEISITNFKALIDAIVTRVLAGTIDSVNFETWASATGLSA